MDEELRELERRARQGDALALATLRQRLSRMVGYPWLSSYYASQFDFVNQQFQRLGRQEGSRPWPTLLVRSKFNKKGERMWQRIKNLRYVTDHWKELSFLMWYTLTADESQRFSGLHHPIDGLFYAFLDNGNVYATLYASGELFSEWVKRPVLYTLPLWIRNTRDIYTQTEVRPGVDYTEYMFPQT